MSNPNLYREHLAALDLILIDALAHAQTSGVSAEAVLFHAGTSGCYHQDDQEIPFRPTPHFVRYVPLVGPDHVVLARPQQKPLVVRVAPKDYWYEVAALPTSYWQEAVELVEVSSLDELPDLLGRLSHTAYVGSDPAVAAKLGIPASMVAPRPVVKALDWHRAKKTAHEVALMEMAVQRAAAGQRRAHELFLERASEREIHWAYLEATGHLESEMPFGTIVAYDEKSATLHYQNKRDEISTPLHTFMLDAGAVADGYAADITRTWLCPTPDPVFENLLNGLDALQRDLVAMVTPGRAYPEIHFAAHKRVAALLCEAGIFTTRPDEALAQGLTRTFLPHGVGHHLGIQVHDVGGHQANLAGDSLPPPPEHRSLRNTRTLEVGHVVTIEPGIYFIPMLLAALRAKPEGKTINWPLVERLTPKGGMRIEDDILVTIAGPRDLTRPHLAGPRGS